MERTAKWRASSLCKCDWLTGYTVAMANTTIITGNLTEDPVLRYTTNGNAVADCGLAVNTYKKDGDPEVSFFKLSVWRDLAEHFAASCQKGDQIVVSGRIEVQRFDRTDGSVGTSVVITADEIGASLRFAEVEIHKVRKEQAAPAPRKRAVRQPVEDEYDDEDINDVPPSTRRAVPASTRRRPVEDDAIEEDEDEETAPVPTTRRVVRKPLFRKVAAQPVEDEDEEGVVF